MSHEGIGDRSEEEDEKAALAMARHLVECMSPGELPLFEETTEALRRERRVKARRDDPLGFGVEEASVLFTAVAYGVAGEVLKSLAQSAGRQTVTGLRGWLHRRRRAVTPTAPEDTAFAVRHPDATSASADAVAAPAETLPPHLLTEVQGIAQRRAVLLGLSPEDADLLAEAVVEYLRGHSGGSD